MNHDARSRIQEGEIGDVRLIHGHYLQDWLFYPTDWNWRLEPELGGDLRAVAVHQLPDGGAQVVEPLGALVHHGADAVTLLLGLPSPDPHVGVGVVRRDEAREVRGLGPGARLVGPGDPAVEGDDHPGFLSQVGKDLVHEVGGEQPQLARLVADFHGAEAERHLQVLVAGVEVVVRVHLGGVEAQDLHGVSFESAHHVFTAVRSS